MGFVSISAHSRDVRSEAVAPPSAAHCQAATPAVTVIDDLDGLEALEADWRALELRAAGLSQVFQSFDWCAAWAWARAGERCLGLNIVTVRIGGRLVLVWPLMRVCVGPLCILRWLSDPYSQYGDVLIDSDVDREEVLAAAWSRIRTLPRIDAIRLRHVRSDAIAASFLSRHCQPVGEADTAPALDLTRFANEAAYDARYTKTQRRRRRRIRQELEEKGALDFRLLRSGAEFDRLIERIIAEKRHWLVERGLHSLPLADPRMVDFIRRLASGRTLELVLSVLSCGGEPVAYEIGLRFGRHHFGYITAHDHRLTDASPARLHMDLSQRRALSDGMRVFDLMVPGDPHKLSWSNMAMEVFDFCAPLTPLGHLYGLAYLDGLRPLARRLYHRASPRIRRKLMRLAGA